MPGTTDLTVTINLNNNNRWELIATVNSGGFLPPNIFLYENSGTTSLGSYIGVASLPEYQRYQTFTGTAIAKFGNRYVLYPTATTTYLSQADAQAGRDHLAASAKMLSDSMKAIASTTSVVTIT